MWADIYADTEEEWFHLRIVPDGVIPDRELEHLVVHELGHVLIDLAKESEYGEEIVVNRIARLAGTNRGVREWNSQATRDGDSCRR